MDKFKRKSVELAITCFISLLNDFGVYPFRIEIFVSDTPVEYVKVETYECEEAE